jgi:phenylalanyl-tRNA synthetase beta chain
VKVSLNTIRAFNKRYGTSDDVAKIGVDKLVEKIGSQLGAVDEVVEIGSKYQGIVIAKVVACEKHTGADKLSLCKVDDGGVVKEVKRDADGLVEVVCGAPNVAVGQTVAWLPPGVTVPESVGKEPFVLEAREIRGVVSNGMIASPKELNLGENHDGILVLEGDYKPGSDFAEVFGLKDDVILDIENKMFTHRPDGFGFLGVARELAGIQGMAYKSPDWYTPNPVFPEPKGDYLPITFSNELPELVPRFTMIAMKNVKVGPSPAWLQVELAKLGQKSINNIVDYSNFFMLETGQPLHAYDYDKVTALSGEAGATIVVRNPRSNEKLKLLNGKEVDPDAESIMIATDKQLIGLGGVMGGSETEVGGSTKNILIEVASFDMYSVRRASMAHGLFTDAVTRFNKGQSPLQNLAVLSKIVTEIVEAGAGETASAVIDNVHLDRSVIDRNSLHIPVKVPTSFINLRLGLNLSPEEMQQILTNVEFKVEIEGENLTVTAPFWRTDIELREDVVEEVGRLYGYDRLPLELPARDLTPAKRDPLFDLKAEIRSRLSRAGANEVLTYSFVPADLMQKTGQDVAKAFQVSNALSPELENYRISLMPSLLDKVHPNIKAGYDEFALFEIGKTHDLDHIDADGLPVEFEFTGLVVTVADKLKKPGSAYYEARKYLEALVGQDLSFKPISDDMLQYPVVQPYDRNRAALVSIKGGVFLGVIGEFKPSVSRGLKLPKHTAGFEIDTTSLSKVLSAGSSYHPLERFPSVKQDITLRVESKIPHEQLFDLVDHELGANGPKNSLINLQGIDIYEKEADKQHRQTTFRITITGEDRTLTDKEVNSVLDAIAAGAKKEIGAERV